VVPADRHRGRHERDPEQQLPVRHDRLGQPDVRLGGWEGNLFRLEGEYEARHARHGRQSLKIALDAAAAPVGEQSGRS